MPKPSLTEKYESRLAEVNAGYKDASTNGWFRNSPDRDLVVYYKVYMSTKGELRFRAVGIALAVRDLIRQRQQQQLLGA